METYHAIRAEEFGIGGGVNGYGRRERIRGAYVIAPSGRRVRAFTDFEGGFCRAEEWAATLNERYGLASSARTADSP